MFYVGQWLWELIICLLKVLKFTSAEFDGDVSTNRKAMRNHFLHSGHRKKKRQAKSLKWSLSRRMVLRIRNLLSERLKIRLCWCRWSNVSWCQNAIQMLFIHSGHSKKRFGPSRESDVLNRRIAVRTHNLPFRSLKKHPSWSRWSDVSRCQKANSFSVSWASKKATWMKLLKKCFK
jgi:hypothetical protein